MNFDVDNWDAPTRRKRATVYFVNSMSDLFHPDVPPNWHMRIWSVMRDTPRYTYQILTKRADVMEQKMKWLNEVYGVLPNVWMGVSVEAQQYADERIPYLLRTSAAIRFLSCEPLLGPVDLSNYLKCEFTTSEPRPYPKGTLLPDGHPTTWRGLRLQSPPIHWVIAGGESGPGARPCHPTWARQLRDQCQAARVAFFWKQWGEFIHTSQTIPGVHYNEAEGRPTGDYFLKCTSKEEAGFLLDGQKWHQFPQ